MITRFTLSILRFKSGSHCKENNTIHDSMNQITLTSHGNHFKIKLFSPVVSPTLHFTEQLPRCLRSAAAEITARGFAGSRIGATHLGRSESQRIYVVLVFNVQLILSQEAKAREQMTLKRPIDNEPAFLIRLR